MRHSYLSTACYHARNGGDRKLHRVCRRVCKFCPELCRCSCHYPGEGFWRQLLRALARQ